MDMEELVWTKEELIISVEDIDKKLKEIEKHRHKFALMLAEKSCPYKEGDVVVDRAGVKAYVDRIDVGGYGQDYYTMYIRKLKKDGTLFKSSQRAWTNAHWSLADPVD